MKEVQREFQGSFKGVPRKSKRWFKEEWKLFQWSFKWDSKVFKNLNGCFKGVSRSFQRNSKVVSRKVIDDSWELSGYLKKFKWYFKCFSMQFQKVWKEVSRNFKTVASVFQENFNVSMKFCFPTFFLHGSHRSYPSRRRACWTSYEQIMKRFLRSCEQVLSNAWTSQVMNKL